MGVGHSNIREKFVDGLPKIQQDYPMTTKKLVPLLFALLGLALVIAAIVVWLEPPEEGGVFTTAGSIILFLSGLGTSIKGWMDVFKKDPPATNTQTQTQNQEQTQNQVVHIHNYPPNSQSPISNLQSPISQKHLTPPTLLLRSRQRT